jgi:putative transcription factor
MDQDWAPVNVGKTGGGATVVPKTAHGITRAKAAGLVKSELRHGAGGNASAQTQTSSGMSAKKLDDSNEGGTLAKVDKSLSKAIMQARTAKKITQKELATAINEKPQVVAEYESGKAIPNPAIIGKLERKLGVKLPRPGKSKVTNSAKTGPGAKTGPAAKTNTVNRGGPPKRK